MTIERVYLAGPMTGIADWNFPAFNAEAARLRAEGLHVENPAEHGEETDKPWEHYMRLAIAKLVTCDRIHMLPGWLDSRGAQIEYALAAVLNMRITGASA